MLSQSCKNLIPSIVPTWILSSLYVCGQTQQYLKNRYRWKVFAGHCSFVCNCFKVCKCLTVVTNDFQLLTNTFVMYSELHMGPARDIKSTFSVLELTDQVQITINEVDVCSMWS